MPTGAIETALKDVVDSRLSALREEIAYCEVQGKPADELTYQMRLIEKLRKSHNGRIRVRIV